MKLEAVAIQTGDGFGVRMGSTGRYISIYVDGMFAGDVNLKRDNDGKPMLTVFAPTDEPRYFDIDLHPRGKEEFESNRHKDFKFFDFDWRTP